MFDDVIPSGFLADLQAAAAAELLAIAVRVQAEHKADLSRRANPPPRFAAPSRPGEFPAGRTFNLRDAVALSPSTREEIGRELRVRVGYLAGAKYGAILAAKGWLSVDDTVDRLGLLGEVGSWGW